MEEEEKNQPPYLAELHVRSEKLDEHTYRAVISARTSAQPALAEVQVITQQAPIPTDVIAQACSHIHVCPGCQSVFVSKRKKQYCSKSCRYQHWREENQGTLPRDRRCAYCGKPFISEYGRECCSAECTAKLRKQRAKAYYEYSAEPRIEEEKVCQWCGKTFTTTNPMKQYCSHLCAQKQASRKYYQKAHKHSQE